MLGLVGAMFVTSVNAQPEQVLHGAAPSWAIPSTLLAVPDTVSGPLFMRMQNLLVHLDQQGQAQYLGYQVKILQPSALELGNLTIV